MTAERTRLEKDSMGEMVVPESALYGASTQRAVLNFPISGQRFPRPFIRALGLIKWAAAQANHDLGLLDAHRAAFIVQAAEEVVEGKLDSQFPLDIFQTALKECDIALAFDRHLHFEGRALVRHPSQRLPEIRQPLEKFKDFYVISLGKAALTMLDALLDRFPPKVRIHGVCSAPSIPKKRRAGIRYFAGGHPLPNEDSLAAARAAVSSSS